MKFYQFQCDMCGALKKDSNHWYVANILRSVGGTAHSFIVGEWDSGESGTEMHLCGRACVLRKMEEWMGGEPEAVA